MSSTLRTLMAGNQITSFIFISSVLVHTHSADKDYSAVMPQTVTALTGSCVQIPCTFHISNFEHKLNKAESIYGIWTKSKSQFKKKDGFIAFNSSENIIRGFSNIQITGNIRERNCTTVFYNIMKNHSDLYYFRLEMEPVFKATFNPSTDVTKKTVRINVRDSPQPPELKPSDLTVMEETTVNLICSAEAPCPKQPPTISWFNISKSALITTQLQEKPDKTQSVVSMLTFKVSYKDNRRNITCIATYPRNTPDASTVETIVMLRVISQSGFSHLVIFGCTGGLLAFLLLSAVFFYCMRKKASRQAHVIGSDQAEDRNRDTMAICTNNVTAISKNDEKNETDDLYYGEMDFSKLQTGHKTEEHSNNVSETEYSELQVTQR
ncbi:myeloid cell surface antigen CD33-like [Carassius auratus]|uniref:Myeloid cell surface antigen CD33-like n=1 Tax=Carassius auratus TaxID=7957 RepID=A0A6P6J8X6_CARAU|nr:myeloid cell surface antigen CD33-like [Carassius auratus]